VLIRWSLAVDPWGNPGVALVLAALDALPVTVREEIPV
jgi:hypothetical protein